MHDPDQPNARDDSPDACALSLLAVATGGSGEIIICRANSSLAEYAPRGRKEPAGSRNVHVMSGRTT